MLWATIEDFPGLWELVWEINRLRPDDQGNLERARDIVENLLEAGAVKLYRSNTLEGEPKELRGEKAGEVVKEDSVWAPPEEAGEMVIRVGATDLGEQQYQAMSGDSGGSG